MSERESYNIYLLTATYRLDYTPRIMAQSYLSMNDFFFCLVFMISQNLRGFMMSLIANRYYCIMKYRLYWPAAHFQRSNNGYTNTNTNRIARLENCSRLLFRRPKKIP